uniref:Uncharacterized protein n=1 Tax=Anguilla anguilla TaxID=7936 RepID=A0A0E9RJQ8_ANGAN
MRARKASRRAASKKGLFHKQIFLHLENF